MEHTGDRKFGLIAGLAFACGTAVIVPSLSVLAITLIAVVAALV